MAQDSQKKGSLPPFAIAGLGLAGATLLFMVPSVLTSLFWGPDKTEKDPEREKIDFCKSVREVVKPGDKRCGKYIALIDSEVAAEKRAEVAAEERKRAEAIEASRPDREISSLELTGCRMALKESMKDPSSFKVNRETRAGGGLIDYTATNGLGGPTRSVYQCTLGENLTSD